MKTNEEILKKVFEHAQKVDEWCAKHNTIRIFTALYGSQNYGTDTEFSDVDTKSVVIAPLTKWLWGDIGEANLVLDMEDGSHAEIKHCAAMFKQYIKGNINFLETLFTPYVDVAPGFEWVYTQLIDAADKIADYNKYRQAFVWLGYINQQLKKAETSRKALASAIRLKESFVDRFEYNKSFETSIYFGDRNPHLILFLRALKDEEKTFTQKECELLRQELIAWAEKEKSFIHSTYKDESNFNVEAYLKMLCVDIFDEAHAKGLSY